MTKISIILLASWTLLFGVDILGVNLVKIPKVYGSPVRKLSANSAKAIVSNPSSQAQHGKSPFNGRHSIKTRQVTYDYEEDIIDPSGGLGAIGMKTFSCLSPFS